MRGTEQSPTRSRRGRALVLLDLTRDRVDPDGAWPVSSAPGVTRFIEGELAYFRQRGRPVVHAVTRFDDDEVQRARADAGGEGASSPAVRAGLSSLWGQFLYFWPMTGAQALTRFMKHEVSQFWERGRPAGLASHLFGLLGPARPAGAPPYNLRGTPGAEIAAPFAPISGEIVIEKAADSAFLGTPLWEQLEDFGVAQVTLVGVESHAAVLATAIDASARGFQLAVPDTCVTSSDLALHRAALCVIENLQGAGARSARPQERR